MPVGLLLLADARLPAGGHAHAGGLEAAVNIGDVTDVPSLETYLRARLATTGRVDAAFAAASAEAASFEEIAQLDAEYAARTPSPYLRGASRRLGRQLERVARRAWPEVDGALPRRIVEIGDPAAGLHHPIVLGIVASTVGGTPDDAATLAIHHLAGAVSSAGSRLLGLDPVELTALHARLADEAAANALSERAWEVAAPAELPADGGTLTEILGERHGGLAARLFAS